MDGGLSSKYMYRLKGMDSKVLHGIAHQQPTAPKHFIHT